MQILIDGTDTVPDWLTESAEEMPIADACDRLAIELRARDRYAVRVTAHDVIAGVVDCDGLDADDSEYYATIGDVTLLEIVTESVSEAAASIERDVSELLALSIVHCRAAADASETGDPDAKIITLDALESVGSILEGVAALQLVRDLEPAKLLDAETIADMVGQIDTEGVNAATVAYCCRGIAEVLERWGA